MYTVGQIMVDIAIGFCSYGPWPFNDSLGSACDEPIDGERHTTAGQVDELTFI